MENLDERYQFIITLVHEYLEEKYNINSFEVMKPKDHDWIIIEVEEPYIRFTVLRDHEWPDIKTNIDNELKLLKESKNALENQDLMKRLITKYLKQKYQIDEVIFLYQRCFTRGLVVELPTIRVKFTVLSNKVWKDVQKYIDNILSGVCNRDEKTECPICFEVKSNIHFTGCSECYHRHCYKCMGGIIRANRGLCVCPFCKHTIGHEMPQEVVDRFVDGLMEKILNNNNALRSVR